MRLERDTHTHKGRVDLPDHAVLLDVQLDVGVRLAVHVLGLQLVVTRLFARQAAYLEYERVRLAVAQDSVKRIQVEIKQEIRLESKPSNNLNKRVPKILIFLFFYFYVTDHNITRFLWKKLLF